MTKATVRLTDGYQAVIRMRDHTLIADEPVSDGGTNAGPTSKELLLAALGACAAITVKMYAQRKGWALESVEIDLSTERFKTADYPAYTTAYATGNTDASGTDGFVHEFRQRIAFKGALTDEQKERLLMIAGKCPVHRALTEPNFMIEELVDAIIAEEA
jgi:putative redox protein